MAPKPRPHTRSPSHPETPIYINIYDLLPPSLLRTLLWPAGLPLLHTGISIHNREYSYGATSPTSPPSKRSGVFWTTPRSEPVGATFRCELLIGITNMSKAEVQDLIVQVGKRFPGEEYNLLSKNCNHFTSHLCRVLTKRDVPGWVNRAAGLGQAVPCFVPKEWVNPPEAVEDVLAVGEGDDEDGDNDNAVGESTRMLPQERWRLRSWLSGTGPKDTDGRGLPASELAPS